MTVVFTDIHGQRGVITEQLAVTYSGDWESAVRAWIVEWRDEWITSKPDDADERSPRLLLNLVMLELPDIVPVRKIERRDPS